MAEREQAHRHKTEDEIVNKEFRLRGRGQTLAIISLVMLLAVVALLAFLGDSTAAATLGSATIIGVVAIFVTGRSYDAKEATATQAPEPAVSDRKQLTRGERRNRDYGRT